MICVTKLKVHYMSEKSDWETPTDFYNLLDEEFHFKLDPCCNIDNQKCEFGYTLKEDGLKMPWSPFGSVFMNPPYGKEIVRWMKKAYEESLEGCIVVCLIPSRTDTDWFHDYVSEAYEIRFIHHRINFVGGPSGSPFPSVVVVFDSRRSFRVVRFWDWKENKYY